MKYNFEKLLSESYVIDNNFLENLISFLWKYNNEDITLKNFSDKYGVNVNLYATNITKNEYTNLNNITYPEIKLKDAIKASMSIPFIFKCVNINGDKFVDGGLKNFYGSPPDDIYIHGYSLVLECVDNSSYISDVLHSIIKMKLPRSTFIIHCKNNTDPNTYLSLNDLDKKYIIDMYIKGIHFARDSLKD